MFFFHHQAPLHSTKFVQDTISRIRNLLPNVPNLIQFGGIAHHNHQHQRLKYFHQQQFPLTNKKKVCWKVLAFFLYPFSLYQFHKNSELQVLESFPATMLCDSAWRTNDGLLRGTSAASSPSCLGSFIMFLSLLLMPEMALGLVA